MITLIYKTKDFGGVSRRSSASTSSVWHYLFGNATIVHMSKMYIEVPEHTATRVALWRILHIEKDTKPHVFIDEIGLRLIGDTQWRDRPDMEPQFSKPMRTLTLLTNIRSTI